MTLHALAEKYGSDKLFSHSYIPFYESLFQGRNVKRLLEIGIGYTDPLHPQLGMTPFVPPHYRPGNSLRMWRDAFPDAEIFACDIREDVLINEGRIHSFACDQSKPSDWWKWDKAGYLYGLNVIIDDGSHVTEHQIITASVLFENHLAPGGIYVIEDCQEPERLVDALGGEIHRFNKRPDDCLVVIRK